MINMFSVDVEDYFCVENMRNIIARDQWDHMDIRVGMNIIRLLDLFDKYDVRVTFFILGWVADKLPEMITEIERRGHEIGTHGYAHRPLTELNKDEFERDILRSLVAISKCVKQNIIGYRAPSFSITPKTAWAWKVLEQNGIKYDSSIFPSSLHFDYRFTGLPLGVYDIDGALKEVSISCVEWFGKRVPCTGGAYFRLFPYWLSKVLFHECLKQGNPVVFYLHPWEIDQEQPRFKLPPVKKFRHYCNLDTTFAKLGRLLSDFKFTGIKRAIYGQ
jgi:polysaccharide deacetylase family protein (PEP-CTERM system associated)